MLLQTHVDPFCFFVLSSVRVVGNFMTLNLTYYISLLEPVNPSRESWIKYWLSKVSFRVGAVGTHNVYWMTNILVNICKALVASGKFTDSCYSVCGLCNWEESNKTNFSDIFTNNISNHFLWNTHLVAISTCTYLLVYAFHKVSMYESPWDDLSEYCCHPILQMPEIKVKMPVR